MGELISWRRYQIGSIGLRASVKQSDRHGDRSQQSQQAEQALQSAHGSK
jgi:hypothetical protein